MTNENMEQNAGSRWAGFWQEIKPAFDIFEETGRLPLVGVEGQSYIVDATN
jgi:murein L,D-transpeptidase YafK